MKNKVCMVWTVFLFFEIQFVQSQELFSLKKALHLVKDAPSIQAGQSMVNKTQADLEMAKGLLYPSFHVQTGYSIGNDPVGVFMAKLQQKGFSQQDFDVQKLNDPNSVGHSQTRLQITQPILHSLIDWRNIKTAQSIKHIEELEQQFRISQMKLRISELYFKSVGAKLRSTIAQEGIDLLERLEKNYGLMEAPTAATTTSYLIAQSVRYFLLSQQSALLTAELNFRKTLLSMLGLAVEQSLVLDSSLPDISDVKMNIETLPTEERFDLKASKIRVQAANESWQASHSQWGPSIDAIGGYNIYTGAYDEFESSYDVGVFLNWSVFQGSRWAQNKVAKSMVQAAKYMHQALSMTAKADRENAQKKLESSLQEYQFIKLSEEKATKAIELAKQRYDRGMLPLFDYSQSIQNWMMVKQQVVMAHEQVALAIKQVEFERGVL